MKRLLAVIVPLFLFTNAGYCEVFENLEIETPKIYEATLAQGSFIPALNLQEISTEICPLGYKVQFEGTDDLYVSDTKILPRGTIFTGYIEKIHEPVVGTNASMKIKVSKLILPDGWEKEIDGNIYTSNDNLIGGEMTEPATWVKIPHYQSKFQGISWNHRGPTIQVRPGGTRSMGKHTKIVSGERLIIIINSPIVIDHILSD